MQTDDEPPDGSKKELTLEQASQEEEMKVRMRVNRLVGLGEGMRELYNSLNQTNGKIAKAYEHHERELALLIAYQEEKFC